MIKFRLYLLIAACAALIGCNAAKTADNAEKGPAPEAPAAPNPPQEGSDKESAGDLSAKPPAGSSLEQKTQPGKAVAVPESLKNQALDYFGVKDDAKFQYEVVSSDGNRNDLKREIKLTSSKPTELVLEETTSSIGGVQKFEHVLRKDGVYSRQIFQDGKKGELQLALPAKLTVGTKWQNKAKVEVMGETPEMSSSSKVVGFEKLKVGNKTYDAVKLSEEASLNGKQPEKWKTTTWLAKGVGLVKMEIERTPKGQPAVKSTMTLK